MDIAASIQFLRENGLTYCGRAGKLETLHQLVTQIEANAVPGIFIEAGVAMGGSASIIAKCKSKVRELNLFAAVTSKALPTSTTSPTPTTCFPLFARLCDDSESSPTPSISIS